MRKKMSHLFDNGDEVICNIFAIILTIMQRNEPKLRYVHSFK